MMIPQIEKIEEVIKHFKRQKCEIVLAGGAIRDFILDKPIKDFDFFVIPEDIEHPKHLLSDLKFLTPVSEVNRKHSGYLESLDYIYSIVTTSYESSPFQFIFISPAFASDLPTYIERQFDIGLCKCYFDGETIRYSKGFLQDMSCELLTVNFNQEVPTKSIQYSVRTHLPRIREKFPSHKVRIDKKCRERLITEFGEEFVKNIEVGNVSSN